jgi:hypothetical protein
MLFDPNDPRMAGKRYLTDDDPQLQRSRQAYLAWGAAAQPNDGDLVPKEARLWFITRTRMVRVAVDLENGALWIHEYPDWTLVPDDDVASMCSRALASDMVGDEEE